MKILIISNNKIKQLNSSIPQGIKKVAKKNMIDYHYLITKHLHNLIIDSNIILLFFILFWINQIMIEKNTIIFCLNINLN